MTTITLVVVAILTCLIFGLAVAAYISIIKSEKTLIRNGEKDEELLNEDIASQKKSSKVWNILSIVFSTIIMVGVLTMAGIGISYKASGQQFLINNQTKLVIVSDSMDGFYSEEYKLTLPEDAKKQQFAIGALLTFNKVSEDETLDVYKVYGYQLPNGKIITHRLIGFSETGLLIFRGDNTAGRDNYVKRDQVILRYTDKKVDNIGLFILFSQSGFGLYSLISVAGVYIISEVFLAKYKKMTQERLKLLKDKGDVLIPNYSISRDRKGRRAGNEA